MANDQTQEAPDEEAQDKGQEDQGEGSAAEAIQDIQQGFQQLQKMLQAAQGQVSPQDMKLFQSAVQATDAFIQSISGPAEGQGQPPPRQAPPPGPMDAHAAQGAKPAGY